MKYKIIRTDSRDTDFIRLVALLNADLLDRYGALLKDYEQFNRIENLRHVIVLYMGDTPAACGAFKIYDDATVELKRIYVDKPYRGRGLSKILIESLERWGAELGYSTAILETGPEQPEAISLYHRCGYRDIPNYPPYVGYDDSLCMKKELRKMGPV